MTTLLETGGKIIAPTVDQINSDHITQVICIFTLHKSNSIESNL